MKMLSRVWLAKNRKKTVENVNSRIPGLNLRLFFFFLPSLKPARAPARTSCAVIGWSTWPRPSTPFVDGFFSAARGPGCIPARTEHAPLVSSPRDHHDSHHAPSEPRRYVRAARPRLASSPIPRGGDRDRRPAPSIAFGNPIAPDLRRDRATVCGRSRRDARFRVIV